MIRHNLMYDLPYFRIRMPRACVENQVAMHDYKHSRFFYQDQKINVSSNATAILKSNAAPKVQKVWKFKKFNETRYTKRYFIAHHNEQNTCHKTHI